MYVHVSLHWFTTLAATAQRLLRERSTRRASQHCRGGGGHDTATVRDATLYQLTALLPRLTKSLDFVCSNLWFFFNVIRVSNLISVLSQLLSEKKQALRNLFQITFYSNLYKILAFSKRFQFNCTAILHLFCPPYFSFQIFYNSQQKEISASISDTVYFCISLQSDRPASNIYK